MNTAKKILTVLASVVLWAVILLAALFAFTTLATQDTANVANLAGFTPLTVQSDSMLPFFKTGDLIIIKSCNPNELVEGDVITFHTIIQNQYALNTHRIARISEENGVRTYTTKGDNNTISDTHIIGNSDIVGKYVTKLPGMGQVLDFLSGSVGFLLVIVLPMLAFFVYQVYHLIMVSINLKKAVAVENALAVQQSNADAQNEELQRMKQEAEAALAEAKRMKEAAEAALAKAKEEKTEKDNQNGDEAK